jgi:hypothetical protein
MTRTVTKAFGALAALALATTGAAYAQKPLLSTKDPVKTQTRLKTDPLKVDVKAPGTAKVTAKGKKK